MKSFQNELIEYSKKIGISKIGFTSCAPFPTLKERLLESRNKGYASGFEEPNLDLRTEPKLLLPAATSIISIALVYPSKLSRPPVSKKGAYRGIFCRASWGVDYHRLVNEKLALLENFIQTHIPDAQCKSMVDTGELVDRAVAERAGIGWNGKNCSIMNDEFGSYMYLGELLTNVNFEYSTPIENLCKDCTKCIDACPTDALIGPGQLDAKRCIAFLTQTKTVIPEQYRKKIGNRLYGCDTCQVVCPYNRIATNQSDERMSPDAELVKPLLKPLLELSNREFKEKYGHMSGSWRGKMPIQRNAILALGNFKDESAIELLKHIIKKDERPVIRATAVWSLGQISEEEIISYVETVYDNESSEIVRLEMEQWKKPTK
ncbi:MAG: tRNA epoxyqueuosine(34) reductase QueG [Bacilli bacterium]